MKVSKEEIFRIQGKPIVTKVHNTTTGTTLFVFQNSVILNKEETLELINWLIMNTDTV